MNTTVLAENFTDQQSQGTITILSTSKNGETKTYNYDFCDLVIKDKNGNLITGNFHPNVILDPHSIPAGKTYYYYTPDGDYFDFVADETITAIITFDKKAKITFGYQKQSKSKTKVVTKTTDYLVTSFDIPSDGFYRFYITNHSTSSVSVERGTITSR
ncbi:hypothetical protein [Marasmitruncus massiliensis]|uniref:hypothetical protein n=1 Tax=Marasmitruncus massiliensis TaxID=1944642 RepID=UPI0011AF6E30|nr:hypothetical protein [Marasmitruncus massiliensis]